MSAAPGHQRTAHLVQWLFYALGASGLVLTAVHVTLDNDPLWVEALDSTILVGLTLIVFYEARQVEAAGLPTRTGVRVFAGVVSTGAGVALLTTAYVVIRLVTGTPLGEDWYLVFSGFLIGVVIGTPAFLYASQLEAELVETTELNKQLRVSQRALRHNLRNELSVILGHVEDLDPDGSPTNADHLGVVRRHLDQLVTLSDHSQSLADVWDEDTTTRFDPHTVAANAIGRVRERHPDVRVENAVPEGLAVVAHDRLELAVTEAVENAVQHTPTDATVTVSAGTNAAGVSLVVADTGDGIAPLDVAALGQSAETPMAHGRGLGLWLIYWVVKKSDGEVAFEGNEPRGTRVVMRLPAV